MGSYVFLGVLCKHLPTISQKDCLLCGPHDKKGLTVIFSSWALRDFSKSSCFFRRASTLSKESPKSSFSRNAWRKNRSLQHHGLLIHLQPKSKSRLWQNTDKKYPMAIKLLRSLRESLVFLYPLKKKKINQNTGKQSLSYILPNTFLIISFKGGRILR